MPTKTRTTGCKSARRQQRALNTLAKAQRRDENLRRQAETQQRAAIVRAEEDRRQADLTAADNRRFADEDLAGVMFEQGKTGQEVFDRLVPAFIVDPEYRRERARLIHDQAYNVFVRYADHDEDDPRLTAVVDLLEQLVPGYDNDDDFDDVHAAAIELGIDISTVRPSAGVELDVDALRQADLAVGWAAAL